MYLFLKQKGMSGGYGITSILSLSRTIVVISVLCSKCCRLGSYQRNTLTTFLNIPANTMEDDDFDYPDEVVSPVFAIGGLLRCWLMLI